MKKQFLIIGTFLTFGLGYSQNTFPTAANTAVGIGTGTTAVPGTGGLRLKVTSGVANTSGVQLTNLTSASPTTTGLLGKALSVNATGNLVLVPVANSATDTSIYNTDGTLSANRTVNMNAKNLTFNPSTANSQFFINGTNGNVGIGNVNPSSKLEVTGVLKSNQGVFNSSQPNGTTYLSGGIKNDKCIVLAAGSEIGTGDGYINTRQLNFYDFPGPNAGSNIGSAFHFGIEDRNDFGRFRMIAYTGGKTYFSVNNRLQQELFTLNEDGNDNVTLALSKPNSFLGIGTTSFVDGTDTYRLAVNGSVRAHRVRVYTTWADFVFEKNYDLPTLEEVEKHIQDNGHLKDIPSAIEVEKNGIELGEMNKRLLQKVEELTLYVIQLNKELGKVKEELKKE